MERNTWSRRSTLTTNMRASAAAVESCECVSWVCRASESSSQRIVLCFFACNNKENKSLNKDAKVCCILFQFVWYNAVVPWWVECCLFFLLSIFDFSVRFVTTVYRTIHIIPTTAGTSRFPVLSIFLKVGLILHAHSLIHWRQMHRTARDTSESRWRKNPCLYAVSVCSRWTRV